MAEPEGEGQPDAVLLTPLTEDTFLHNLHVRYKANIIYTYVGNALVSVNPCRALPLYSAELVRAYLACPPHLLPPHLYAVTAAAYRWVRDRNESQCIVMTGESGAGKTEAARVCLQCAVVAGGRAAGPALTAAGTLLEAFGNAATARNHNASRFGKLLEIEFDFKGEPVGGYITHYLLEKERVCEVAEGERNFHVLYQLLAGADVSLLKRLRLHRSWEQYRILRGAAPSSATSSSSPRRGAAGPAPRAAAQDRDHFAFTTAALAALGFGAGELDSLLRVLAFLLKLGNVQFEPQHNIDGTIGTRLHQHYELVEACALVGVDADELASALAPDVDEPREPESSEGSEEGGADEWAGARRDRLLCALYSRLFTWLVNFVNNAIKGSGEGARCSLGILDVYGLESLARNGLERLLINYAAERVQAVAGAAAARREAQAYAREGLAWHPPAAAAELAPSAADLLDAGPDALLAALADCSTRGAPDAALLQRLQRRRHPLLRVLPPDRFQVMHFGGPVVYSARGMVEKNRDTVCRRCCAALAGARSQLLAALFAGGSSPRRPAALASRQRALLAALQRRLAAPRFVRCLRNDAALRPHRFDAPLVRHQLHTQGIVEMAQLRRAGWCESMCARALVERYGLLAPSPPLRASPAPSAPSSPGAEPVRAARRLLRALPVPTAEFAFGRTRVFIRSPRTVWELEAMRAARVDALVAAVQRAWRVHRLRRRAAAATVIARAWRRRRTPESGSRRRAAQVLWRAWCTAARRRFLTALWARLPARHRSPTCGAWPPCPAPRLLGATDALLRRVHHCWRCAQYRAAFDQTARNRMREKVTASALFLGRKATYARSVSHPFVGDYVRLRASAGWRRGAGADRYVVFADAVRKVARASGRLARCLAVLSTHALLLLDARSLRLKRRVPAHLVHRLSLSPYADDLLVVHVRAGAGPESSPEEESQCSSRGAIDAPGCLSAGEGAARRRGDVVLRACHSLELATKLFLVVQHAAGAPPAVTVAPEFEADFGGRLVTVAFHVVGAQPPRLLRRADRLDVLV